MAALTKECKTEAQVEAKKSAAEALGRWLLKLTGREQCQTDNPFLVAQWKRLNSRNGGFSEWRGVLQKKRNYPGAGFY